MSRVKLKNRNYFLHFCLDASTDGTDSLPILICLLFLLTEETFQ